MKVSKNLFGVIAAILIVVALVGPLDQKSHTFIKGATEKTMKFHSLISEVKMVLAGLSEIKVPFISGHTNELGNSLGQAKDYLLKISAIVFSQLMLLAISQTWVFKLLLLLLFALFLLNKSSSLSMKVLIILLAINPGLSIYTSGVELISQKSAIDFGEAYLTKLETQVAAIKNEKSQLMKQHQQQQEQIKNGEKHVNILGRLKEDVSYDFKKIDDDVKGGFAQIRLLIREAGHEMTMKVYNFCTMILFSFLLLPIGYVLIVYVLYKNTFHSVAIMVSDGKELLGQVETDAKSVSFVKRIANAVKAAWHELAALPEKGVADIEQKAENADADIYNKIADIREGYQSELHKLKSDGHGTVVHAEDLVAGDVEKVDNTLANVVDKTENTIGTDASKVQQDVSNVDKHVVADVDHAQQNFVGDIHSGKNQVKEAIDDTNVFVSREAHTAEGLVENVALHAKDDEKNISSDLRDEADEINQNIKHNTEDVKTNIENSISAAEDDIHVDKEHVESSVQNLENKLDEGLNTIKGKVEGEKEDPIISI